MAEIIWPNYEPPPWGGLSELGKHRLDEVNLVARECPATTRFEHELLEILRSQALAIGLLSEELLRLREDAVLKPDVEYP